MLGSKPYENAVQDHMINQQFDNHSDYFEYKVKKNLGDVFHSVEIIDGKKISGSGIYDTKFRFQIPTKIGYMSEFKIESVLTTDGELDVAHFLGNLLFRDIRIVTDNGYDLGHNTKEYIQSRVDSLPYGKRQVYENALIPQEIQSAVANTYECYTTSFFPFTEETNNFYDTNHAGGLFVDVTTNYSAALMNIDPEITSFSCRLICNFFRYYDEHVDRPFRPISMIGYDIESERPLAIPSGVWSVSVPIECKQSAFELSVQALNAQMDNLDVIRFELIKDTKVVVDLRRRINFNNYETVYSDKNVGSLVYNFGVDNSRSHKTGSIPLSKGTYTLKAYFNEETVDTDYSLHVIWTYWTVINIDSNGFVTKVICP